MDENMAANATVEETEPVVETEEATETVEDGAAAVEPTEDITKTQAFSRRLNEMSSKAVDDFVAGMGWSNEITGEKITTRKQFERYQRMKAAEAEGKDPVTTAQLDDVSSQLAHYRNQEQDAALKNDPEMGEVYAMVRDDVMNLVDYCRRNGRTDVDVDAAFKAVLPQNAGKILKTIKASATSKAIKESASAAKASPGKLSGGDIPQNIDYSTMSDAEFEKQIQLAKRGALKKR